MSRTIWVLRQMWRHYFSVSWLGGSSSISESVCYYNCIHTQLWQSGIMGISMVGEIYTYFSLLLYKEMYIVNDFSHSIPNYGTMNLRLVYFAVKRTWLYFSIQPEAPNLYRGLSALLAYNEIVIMTAVIKIIVLLKWTVLNRLVWVSIYQHFLYWHCYDYWNSDVGVKFSKFQCDTWREMFSRDLFISAV